MKKAVVLLAFMALAATCGSVGASGGDDADLGFEAAFPQKIYQKKYFALGITGATFVASGAFSYFTAGAGAPAAATFVGTVASWVGGGGAGSYMAGLSTVGGWFGGNAMLGSAILNGISLSTIGGMGSWGSLSAGQKALALTATAATAIDGIAIVSSPSTQQVEWRVRLAVPRGLAVDRIGTLVDDMSEIDTKLEKLANELDSAKKDARQSTQATESSGKVTEARLALDAARARHKEVSGRLESEVNRVLKSGGSNRDTVVLAVLAHNAGQPAKFRTLLRKVAPDRLARRSYLDYLRAVAALQTGNTAEAERLLYATLKTANFAVEPPILLVSVLGARGYAAREGDIDEVARYAQKHFDADAYVTTGSLVSLHYRVGSLALNSKRCYTAHSEFEKAQSALSMVDKYWSGKDVRDIVDIGLANALHCQGRSAEASELFQTVVNRAPSQDARSLYCVQFSGGCASR